jgi:hypothetical protein
MKSAIISQGGFGFLKAVKEVITRGNARCVLHNGNEGHNKITFRIVRIFIVICYIHEACVLQNPIRYWFRNPSFIKNSSKEKGVTIRIATPIIFIILLIHEVHQLCPYVPKEGQHLYVRSVHKQPFAYK